MSSISTTHLVSTNKPTCRPTHAPFPLPSHPPLSPTSQLRLRTNQKLPRTRLRVEQKRPLLLRDDVDRRESHPVSLPQRHARHARHRNHRSRLQAARQQMQRPAVESRPRQLPKQTVRNHSLHLHLLETPAFAPPPPRPIAHAVAPDSPLAPHASPRSRNETHASAGNWRNRVPAKNGCFLSCTNPGAAESRF